jgi:hypothetical protein
VLDARAGFPQHFSRTTRALLFFEAWNLVVIGAAIVGFNHVKVLAECQLLASVLLWIRSRHGGRDAPECCGLDERLGGADGPTR